MSVESGDWVVARKNVVVGRFVDLVPVEMFWWSATIVPEEKFAEKVYSDGFWNGSDITFTDVKSGVKADHAICRYDEKTGMFFLRGLR